MNEPNMPIYEIPAHLPNRIIHWAYEADKLKNTNPTAISCVEALRNTTPDFEQIGISEANEEHYFNAALDLVLNHYVELRKYYDDHYVLN